MSDSIDSKLLAIEENPYSITCRLDIAQKYGSLGYPDLAAGEAYMALLLIDEIREESGEYHEEAIETATQDMENEKSTEESAEEWATTQIERDT
jgi:hypothetical protein